MISIGDEKRRKSGGTVGTLIGRKVQKVVTKVVTVTDKLDFEDCKVLAGRKVILR